MGRPSSWSSLFILTAHFFRPICSSSTGNLRTLRKYEHVAIHTQFVVRPIVILTQRQTKQRDALVLSDSHTSNCTGLMLRTVMDYHNATILSAMCRLYDMSCPLCLGSIPRCPTPQKSWRCPCYIFLFLITIVRVMVLFLSGSLSLLEFVCFVLIE